MGKRIVSIGLIWLCTAIAWMTLAGTMGQRDAEKGSTNRKSVRELWGRPLKQDAPRVLIETARATTEKGESRVDVTTIPLAGSDLRVQLDLTHRKKGLQWYPTYGVTFDGTYRVKNPYDRPVAAVLTLPLPDARAVYDNFRISWGSEAVEEITLIDGVIRQSIELAAGEEAQFTVSYASQGMSTWFYAFGDDARQVRNFSLQMDTNFEAIDFPDTGSSPTSKERTPEGWRLNWQYGNLLSGVHIGMVMPERLNPGPWVKQVSRAAPVSLFLFFFLLFIVSTLRGVKIHPMNYFFVAVAFFSYHLLLSYLVDHVSIHLAFWICSAVSTFLVVSYMRLVVGPRMALIDVGLSQVVYLVLFSYTFFFAGFTGLAITILGISTLFVVMQITGRLDWEALFKEERASAESNVAGVGRPGAGPPLPVEP